MIRKFLTFLFICIFSFGLAQVRIDRIENLSKSPQTIEKAVEELIKYIVQNRGLSKEEEVFACALYSKRRLLEKYGDRYPELMDLITREDWENFRKKLLILKESLDEDFKLVFNIFPQLKIDIDDLFHSIDNKDYEKVKEKLKRVKYLWKIPGYNSFFENRSDLLVYPVMLITLEDPTLLDTDLKRFLYGVFSSVDFLTLERSFTAQFSNLDETDYIAALKFSEFLIEGLNKKGEAPNNELIGIYAELSLYFSLEKSLYAFAQNFSNIPNEILAKKLIELTNYLESWENLKIKRERLKNQMISMLSELAIRTQFIDKVNLKETELETLKKLISNINTPEFVTKLSLILSSLSKAPARVPERTDSKDRDHNFRKLLKLFLVFLPFILFVVILTFLPLRLKANLFGRIGFKKMALYFFRKMLKKNPSSPTLHAELAAMYEKLGMIDQARIEYKIAMRLLENLETKTRRVKHENSNF